jgi:hypothetical protein
VATHAEQGLCACIETRDPSVARDDHDRCREEIENVRKARGFEQPGE